MNMGLYTAWDLYHAYGKLREVRSSKHPGEEEIKRLKCSGVDWEDLVLKAVLGESWPGAPNWSPLSTRVQEEFPRPIYKGSDVPRMLYRMLDIDLIKYQANWKPVPCDEYELKPMRGTVRGTVRP